MTTRSARSATTPAVSLSRPRSSSAAAMTPTPPPSRCRRARRSTWWRRNFSPSPTGSATRWSQTSAARSPAMARSCPPTIDGAVSPAPINPRPSEFHWARRRPHRCLARHPPYLGGAAAGQHRQSRQPERSGRAREVSDLYHARRHFRLRPEFQPPGNRGRRHRSIAPSIRTPRSPTAPRPAMPTETSTSMAASAGSATS